MVTDVIVGQSILHMADPRGQRGNVNFKATSKGMQRKATVRSATARFTSKKLRVVRMRGVRMMTRQTSVFPMTLATKIAANMVYCKASSHLGWEPGTASVKLPFNVELVVVMVDMFLLIQFQDLL